MKALLLLSCVAASALAQSPEVIVRRHEQQRRSAQRAVAAAVAAEGRLPSTRPARGTLAVIAGTVAGNQLPGFGNGLAELIATDLAHVHAVRLVERVRAQALVDERALGASDDWGRPLAWHWIGAADIVVLDATQRDNTVRLSARVVNLARQRVDATLMQSGTLRDLFAVERRLVLDILRTVGVEPTAGERRTILDRPAADLDAFLAYAAAMDALEGGDAPQADRLLQRALQLDAGVNAAFDASALAVAGLGANLAAIVPVPGATDAAGDDPTAEGLATEGNESEYGEAWFEGTGDRSLHLYEMAVPLNASLALARGRLDLSTLWASNRADTPANDVFHAWGFTDVHVRYTQPVGTSGLSLTLGGAFPTRDVHGVDDDIRRIPIAPDMLPSAMYRRRSAASVSGGFYFTRPLGAWTWGAAAGTEWSASYNERTPSLSAIAVAPGMRWRLRGDAVRPWGRGRVALATSWMGLSPATRGGATIQGGDRLLGRASYAVPVGAFDIEAGGWLLRTAEVTYHSALSLRSELRHASTLAAGFLSARSHAGAWTFDTNVELKRWEAGAGKVADLIVPQLNLAHPLGRGFAFEVGADYVSGHFHEAPSVRDIPVRGWMLHAGFRLEP